MSKTPSDRADGSVDIANPQGGFRHFRYSVRRRYRAAAAGLARLLARRRPVPSARRLEAAVLEVHAAMDRVDEEIRSLESLSRRRRAVIERAARDLVAMLRVIPRRGGRRSGERAPLQVAIEPPGGEGGESRGADPPAIPGVLHRGFVETGSDGSDCGDSRCWCKSEAKAR